jgi:hypothetical protein
MCSFSFCLWLRSLLSTDSGSESISIGHCWFLVVVLWSASRVWCRGQLGTFLEGLVFFSSVCVGLRVECCSNALSIRSNRSSFLALTTFCSIHISPCERPWPLMSGFVA